MNKLLSIGLKIIGLYFCFLTIELVSSVAIQYYQNVLLEKSFFESEILASLILNFLLFVITSWILIYRNNFIKHKLFKINALSSEKTEISSLSFSEILLLVFKLIGFFLILKNVIVLICAATTIIQFSQRESDLMSITIKTLLLESSKPFLKILVGIILLFFTEKFLKLINESSSTTNN